MIELTEGELKKRIETTLRVCLEDTEYDEWQKANAHSSELVVGYEDLKNILDEARKDFWTLIPTEAKKAYELGVNPTLSGYSLVDSYTLIQKILKWFGSQ